MACMKPTEVKFGIKNEEGKTVLVIKNCRIVQRG